MAFKMKGSAFYGHGNQSPIKKTGAFITDVDKLTGEKSQKRATYADTRKAEKEGKAVVYTNKEAAMRSKKTQDNALKGVRDDGSKAGTINDLNEADSRKKRAGMEAKGLARRKAYIKEHKSDDASKKARHLDRAAQDKIERDAVVAAKKKKGDRTNTKPLRRDQRGALSDNKTSIRKGKADLNKADTESGISETFGAKTKERNDADSRRSTMNYRVDPGNKKKAPLEKRDVYIDGERVREGGGTGKKAREAGMAQEKINKKIEAWNANPNNKDKQRKGNKTVRYTSGLEKGDIGAKRLKATHKKYPNAQVLSQNDDVTDRIKAEETSKRLATERDGYSDKHGTTSGVTYADPKENKKRDRKISKGKYAKSTEFNKKGNKATEAGSTRLTDKKATGKRGSSFEGMKPGTIIADNNVKKKARVTKLISKKKLKGMPL